ncbi:HPr(Ser) kinase/phosphatase [Synoicihabitans lomoniglobus]|uniref:HPr kinase/phosphorylase n=1 Tax=Synoicihabitans lomoniglobus TaxID=2909285 RepID=A0AAF0CPY4_9BACT|nr:HPr(Ser) kinase/phosphatase [Opitutaceae bacterium LMO-M01]WED65884.1 HPr(Ser) kinase/phosphatase [Opitutaceae bacterium LMO-M01]
MNRTISGITVEHFFTTYREKLKLELLAGENGLHRLVKEGTINRPSLALTGFYKFFANKRVQVLGAAEMTYLRTLTGDQQEEVFRAMARRQVPCFVLARNYVPTRTMLQVCREMKLPLFRTSMITRHWINLATLCIDNEFAPFTSEHATMLDVKGIGVLLRGDSGVGKSECALALIERGYSLVADDLTHIRLVDERELIATGPALNRGYMEVRGIGIINVAEMFGIKNVRNEKRVDMVVSLHEWTPEVSEERTGLEENFYPILDQQVPAVDLYVRPGRDIARLVEVAALVQALKIMGHDPAKEFNERLIRHMANGPEDRPTITRLSRE